MMTLKAKVYHNAENVKSVEFVSRMGRCEFEDDSSCGSDLPRYKVSE